MSGNPNDHNDPNRQGQYNDPNRPGPYNNDPNRPGPYNDPSRQGQYPPPPQWSTSQPEENSPAQYPPASQYQYPPASYAPAPDHHYQPPSQYPPAPPSQYPPPSNMAMHPHVQGPQDPYRLPHPGAYRAPDVYAQPPPPPQVVYQAAAPRQRTAIACRYCRRRKIRCSGFESSTDGRCSNCIRFNQECMFTPVSSQAQAFVPAHAAYPHLRNVQNPGRAGGPPVTLYGAHGQPLPPQQQPETLPPPQGLYQHPYGHAPPPPQDHVSREFLFGSSFIHYFDLQRPIGRRGSGSGFEYPDPTNLAPVTPTTSASGYQAHPAPMPYYPPPQQHDRRPSPQSAYAYDSRHSSSPHSSPYPPMHPSQGAMTPPPTFTPGGSSRGGLNVRDMLNPGDNPGQPPADGQARSGDARSGDRSADGQGRSSTDSDMLNALNRRGPQ
ncbi:hypothetical protein BO70DRAFT_27283 [Aspergillus heteromorphus CBS 117.55]|uniref:Zn(2)-C6 fungal-type domain-containing protein n=1 Tax=Aspergillus heteromorphus CBS 117.55 TaxID=1448321 RepID=A0A317WCL2_9EURO|nr:uncharacterized protein BO70DRAFT_27283 [Aspergillus heteromorphus CBS 117.55]PWY83501.1 hypothetical protein BO70DRAFT_27283 [Aspergillus heteromorphus CBS 117.55]